MGDKGGETAHGETEASIMASLKWGGVLPSMEAALKPQAPMLSVGSHAIGGLVVVDSLGLLLVWRPVLNCSVPSFGIYGSFFNTSRDQDC